MSKPVSRFSGGGAAGAAAPSWDGSSAGVAPLRAPSAPACSPADSLASSCSTSRVAYWTTLGSPLAPDPELPAAPGDEGPRDDAREENESDQDESRRPRLPVVGRIGRLRVLEDLQRHRRERLARVELQLVADERRGEEERRGLAGDARDRQGRAGDDPPDRLREHDAQRRPPAADAEGQARLARRLGYEREDLLRRPGNERDHQDRERERAREAALAVSGDDEREDEDPDHDRRDAVQDVEREGDEEGHPPRRELVQVDRRQHADRKRDGGGDSDDHDRADERVRETGRHRRE